jgi:hypothetical protein
MLGEAIGSPYISIAACRCSFLIVSFSIFGGLSTLVMGAAFGARRLLTAA